MKIITTSIIITVLSIMTLVTASAQKQDEFTGALLWKISGNGLEKPSYVLGTHHLTQISFVDSIKGLKGIIESAEQTVGELLISDQTAMQAKLQQAAMMPAGESYSKLLSPEDYIKLNTGLKDMLGVGIDQFGMLKPGMISMIYTITFYTKLYPEFNPMSHEAIDSYVQRMATEKGKPVLELETVEDQIHATFDAEPLKDQAKSLVCAVENKDIAEEQLKLLNTYYKRGQLDKMYDISFNNPDDPCKISQEQQNALIKNRNDKWLAKLPLIMKEKSSLIAVGALHLPAEDGLLYQLAKLGYKVEPVK